MARNRKNKANYSKQINYRKELIAAKSERDKTRNKLLSLNQKVEKYKTYYGKLKGNKSFIKRQLKFAPEHKQAAISILSYFSRIIEQKYPNVESAIKIEQEQSNIRLVVETNKGDRESVETTLDDYFLVVTGQKDLYDFLPDSVHVLELKHKLRIAYLEIENTKEILELTKNNYESNLHKQDKRIENLESQLEILTTSMRDSVISTHKQQESILSILDNSVNSHNHDETLIKLIELLKSQIKNSDLKSDESGITDTLEEIRNHSPTFLENIAAGIISSSTGSILANWFIAAYPYIPKI